MTRLGDRAATRRCLVLSLTVAMLAPIVVAGPAVADPTRFAPPPVGWAGDPARVLRYQPPVDGPVLRPFDPPASPHGPGHRGVDLDVTVGTVVRAAADGSVAFAGGVAGTTWVSVAHPDGVITSYGPIAATRVRRADEVVGGQPLGTLAAGGHGSGDVGLHWGARRGGAYIDPFTLLDHGVPRPSLIGDGGWRAVGHVVTAYEPWAGGRWWGLGYHGSPEAEAPGFAVPPNPNHLVTVAGLGSSSASVAIEPEHLGYDPRSVTALSYAGRSPALGALDDPRRDQLPYGASDTWAGVEAASALLRDQLRAQRAREPGRAVDLLGYSMGGLVILHYLATHHDAYDPTLPPIGHVVTVASPLRGSDLATLGTDVREHRLYGRAVDSLQDRLARSEGPIGRWVGALPPDVAAIDDVRVGSALLRDLADGLDAAFVAGAGGPLAMGTRILTIGGGTDAVVGAGRATLPVAPLPDGSVGEDGLEVAHRILPGGHGAVRSSEAVREVVWRFLADEEVVASPGRLSTGASTVAGALVGYAGWRLAVSDRRMAPLVPDRDRP